MEDFKKQEPTFEKIPGIDKNLVAQGVYMKGKVITKAIGATGDVNILCGFPPKIVIAIVEDTNQSSTGSTDFTTTHSIRNYDNAGTFATTSASNLVTMGTLIANVTKKLHNGFTVNVSTFSGASKTISFTCFQ